MKTLTAENVNAVFMDCLFRDGEDTSNPAVGEGVLHKFGFHRERLEAHRDEIKQMLNCLPDNFQASKGGGWSFLNACMTKDGEQWGEHRSIEQLLALGLASGQATMLMPREMWKVLPGGMPYFSVVSAQTANPSSAIRPTMTNDCNESVEAGFGAANGSALDAARLLAKAFAVEWQGTRRDTCHAIGEKMLELNSEQSSVAWASLAGHLIRLGERDIPKFMDVIAGINAATMVGVVRAPNDPSSAPSPFRASRPTPKSETPPNECHA